MNRIMEVGYSERDNLIDFYLHEVALAFIILSVFGLIGLFLGWLTWRSSKKKFDELERENEELLERYRELRDAP